MNGIVEKIAGSGRKHVLWEKVSEIPLERCLTPEELSFVLNNTGKFLGMIRDNIEVLVGEFPEIRLKSENSTLSLIIDGFTHPSRWKWKN